LASDSQKPFFLLTDAKGGILYGSLSSQTQPARPVTAALRDWPGFKTAQGGTSAKGLVSLEDGYYLVVSVPVVRQGTVRGVLMLGDALDAGTLHAIRSTTQDDLAFYADGKIRSSTFAEIFAPEVAKTAFVPRHQALPIAGKSFLWEDLPLQGLDGSSGARFFLFEPLKESVIVQGSPKLAILRWGWVLLTTLFVLGLWYSFHLLSPLRQMTRQVREIHEGNWDTPLPIGRMDAWGSLADSLSDLLGNLREKERLSMVLGKVIAPQAAQKVLSNRDYFSLKGERRECTLLQAQLKGFHTLSQNMPPETLVEALNRYLSFINETVFKHEGMLDRFIGETALAVWGAPLAMEDKEERAVKAALEMQEALKKLNIARIEKGQPAFSLGIAVHTGQVVTGNLGSEKFHDYSVIGEPLQVVSHLCSLAAPGQVIVSEETYEKVKDKVKAEPLAPVAIKGADKPLKTYGVSKWA
jgi:class 3 adenylate cyclase